MRCETSPWFKQCSKTTKNHQKPVHRANSSPRNLTVIKVGEAAAVNVSVAFIWVWGCCIGVYIASAAGRMMNPPSGIQTSLLYAHGLVIAVACGVASERRIPASCRDKAGGAAGVPGESHSLFGILSNSIASSRSLRQLYIDTHRGGNE